MRRVEKVESDSVLSALILGAAALLLGAFEAGAGAAARALRERKESRERLSPALGLPGGPTASLRCASAVAFSAALAAAVAAAVEGWGMRWELVMPAAALALGALAAVAVGGRLLGARFADAALPAACRAAWALSFPFRPALLIQSRLSAKLSALGADAGLGIAADRYEPLDEHEARMIRGVVRLDKTPARRIMTPRVDMAAASADATISELANVMIAEGHSRIPVFSESGLDDIIGVAHARDLLQILAGGENAEGKTAGGVARGDAMKVPEYKTLEDLLREFQEKQTHLAVVVDEYGGVSGIVTIEDLLEEIVGEIHDEFDERELPVRPLGGSEYLVDAGLSLDEFNRELEVNAETVGNGFDTIGGLVFDRLGKIPVAGDEVEYDGLTIEVVSASARRPISLKVRRRE